MKIWIFQTGEPLHGDGGVPRPMRAMNLANALLARGHEVVIWSAAFYHQEKHHRCKEFLIERVSGNLTICFVPSPGYSTSVGLGRLYDHAILAKNLHNELIQSDLPTPDVAFVGYPPIEFAYVAAFWLKRNSIPFVVDVKDQWPDIFVRAFPKSVSPIARIIFSPYFYFGGSVMRNSTALCSMTDAFLDWARSFAGRPPNPNDFTLPLVPVLSSQGGDEKIDDASAWLHDNKIFDDKNLFRVFFVGNFMSSAFDFDPIIDAAEYAVKSELNWQFVLCGDGDQWGSIRARCSNLPNIIMPGRVDRNKMVAVSRISNLGVAPIRNNPDYLLSIPNKIIDYFSLGLPVATSLGGEVEKLICTWNAGMKYSKTEGRSLHDVIKLYYYDHELAMQHAVNSQLLYRTEFDGDKIYQNAVMRIEQLAK